MDIPVKTVPRKKPEIQYTNLFGKGKGGKEEGDQTVGLTQNLFKILIQLSRKYVSTRYILRIYKSIKVLAFRRLHHNIGLDFYLRG